MINNFETGAGNKVEKEAQLKELAAENFAAWNGALLSKDPKAVAALYSGDASFLPTLNPEFKHGRDGAEAYFHHFLEKDPEGKVIDEAVQQTSTDENGNVTGFLHSGMYDFTVGQPDDRQVAKARFTFLWQKDAEGNWKIAHHHSSLVPQA